MNLRNLMMGLTLAIVLGVSCAQAQDQPQQPPDTNTPDAPVPPVTPDQTGNAGYSQPPIPVAIGGITDAAGEPGADTLAGPVAFGVTSPTGRANVFDPAVHASVGADTGIVPGQTNADITLGATLGFDHFWARNEFIMQYSGGFNIYRPASIDDAQYHVFSISDINQFGRITLRFRDDFSDSSGAVFGGLNIGGPAVSTPTGFINGLAPNFTLDQSIYTTTASRIGNTTLGELDYALNRHATLTFAANYQLLDFLTAGYVNSNYEDGRVGYTFQVDRRNSVALIYDFNYTTFSPASGAVQSHTPQFAYGLKLNGRLALQFAGGPQIIITQNPGASSTSQWAWNFSSALNYRQRRTSYSLSYSHGLTSGSGVFLGALSDNINGSIATQYHRNWTPSVSAGYSRNGTLAVDSSMSSFFGAWYASASLGRVWGRSLHTTASYSLQDQTTNAASCPVASCGPNVLSQLFTITLDWHPVPTVGANVR